MALMGTAGQSQALNSLDGGATNLLAFTSLHTATPGTTGASEYAGVTRQSTAWSASSGGSAKTNSGALSFTTSGATPVTHVGTFSLVSGGVYGIGLPLASSVTATTITVAAGALSLTAS